MRELFNRDLELSELTGTVGIPSYKIKNTCSALKMNLGYLSFSRKSNLPLKICVLVLKIYFCLAG